MTLESTINKNRYVGNGATTEFPFTFKVWESNQVLVFVGDGLTEQDVSSECTVQITSTGGTVTFSTAPAPGIVIVIRRSMPYIQEDDYRNGSRFNAEEIEDRFDQDCAERQDLRLDVDRSIKVPMTSEANPDEFFLEFWGVYNEMVPVYESFMSEVDHQVQRAENISAIVGEDTGNSCMEMSWILPADVPAGTDIDIHPLWYVVGRHHIQVTVNGVRHYRGKQYNEKGDEDSHSNHITTLVNLRAGDVLNVWVNHLNGTTVSSLATSEHDGLMPSGDKAKLDNIEQNAQENVIEKVKFNGSELSINNKAVDIPSDSTKLDKTSISRLTHTFSSSVSSGTSIDVPTHAGTNGLLLVFHNGVLCEPGAGGQYNNVSDTSITFNYSLAAGDTVTAVAIRTE